MTYQKQWVERDDNVQGFIYLMEAEGYHGIVPGCLLKRCKIGLSRNPEKRLDDFHSNQPPCNVKIVRTIFVEDMATVEAELHRKFKHCKVKLIKSREWYDFHPLHLWQVNLAFNRYEKPQFTLPKLPSRLVIGCLIGLIGTSLLIHSASFSPKPIKVIPSPTQKTLTIPKVLHKIKRSPSKIKTA